MMWRLCSRTHLPDLRHSDRSPTCSLLLRCLKLAKEASMPCTKAESPVCTNLGIYHAILSDDYELTLASQRRLECAPEVNGFTDAKYKKFDSRSDAEAFVASG